MASSQLTTFTPANPLNPSIFPSLTHLPENLDSYSVNTWVRTGYWPWMSESSPQIPANTSARLVKTAMNEGSLLPDQCPSVLKRKRSVTASEGSTVALYRQFYRFSREYDTSSQSAGSEAGEMLEATTPADESHCQSPSALKRMRTVSLASAEALDQELIALAGDSSISSQNTAGDAAVATAVLNARPPPPSSHVSTNPEQELLCLCGSASSSTSEALAVETPEATGGSVANRRQLLSTLTFQSLLSDHSASPPKGVSYYFHFRETWSNFGTCMEEDPEPESYVPEVDGDEARGGRVDNVTKTILDGLNEEGNERSHAEKVERARLGVEFWREGRSSAEGMSVLIWKEGVRMFIVRK